VSKYSSKNVAGLYKQDFDRQKIAQKKLPYERLDQLTMDILLGVR